MGVVWVLNHYADVNAQTNENVSLRRCILRWPRYSFGFVSIAARTLMRRTHYIGRKVSRPRLLEHGANANALDVKGRTLLHQASKSGRVVGSQVLLEHQVLADRIQEDLRHWLTHQ